MVTVVGRLLQPRDSKLQNLPAGMLPEKNITANLVSISQENQKTCLERKIKYSRHSFSKNCFESENNKCYLCSVRKQFSASVS